MFAVAYVQIFATIPEKKVKFTGKASEEEIPEVIKGVFTITQRPSVILNGGQALITFEEEKGSITRNLGET